MAAMTKLSAKQEAYCQEFIADLNMVAAARRAGYSVKSAHVSAANNMENPLVQARIAELKRASFERAQVDADWLLRRLVDEAEADLADLYFDNGQLRPIKEWPEIWRKGLVTGIKTETVGRGEDAFPVVEVKLSDRVKRLELIGRHSEVAAFTDTGERDPAPIHITINRPGADNGD